LLGQAEFGQKAENLTRLPVYIKFLNKLVGVPYGLAMEAVERTVSGVYIEFISSAKRAVTNKIYTFLESRLDTQSAD
jgi:hypothetical protein